MARGVRAALGRGRSASAQGYAGGSAPGRAAAPEVYLARRNTEGKFRRHG